MWFCVSLPNFTEIVPPKPEFMDVILGFQNGGQGVANLLLVSSLATSLISEVQNLFPDQINVIHLNLHQDITTDGFGKQMAAILQFYFWF